MSVAYRPVASNCAIWAGRLAGEAGFPVSDGITRSKWTVQVNPHKLSLHEHITPLRTGPQHSAEFIRTPNAIRELLSSSAESALVRSCTVPEKARDETCVVQLSAGIGNESGVLALHFKTVTMLEEDVVLRQLLRDGLRRAHRQLQRAKLTGRCNSDGGRAAVSGIERVCSSLSFSQSNARGLLIRWAHSALKGDGAPRPDVILFSDLSLLEPRLAQFRKLNDEEYLLDLALLAAKERVVIHQESSDPPAGKALSQVYSGASGNYISLMACGASGLHERQRAELTFLVREAVKGTLASDLAGLGEEYVADLMASCRGAPPTPDTPLSDGSSQDSEAELRAEEPLFERQMKRRDTVIPLTIIAELEGEENDNGSAYAEQETSSPPESSPAEATPEEHATAANPTEPTPTEASTEPTPPITTDATPTPTEPTPPTTTDATPTPTEPTTTSAEFATPASPIAEASTEPSHATPTEPTPTPTEPTPKPTETTPTPTEPTPTPTEPTPNPTEPTPTPAPAELAPPVRPTSETPNSTATPTEPTVKVPGNPVTITREEPEKPNATTPTGDSPAEPGVVKPADPKGSATQGEPATETPTQPPTPQSAEPASSPEPSHAGEAPSTGSANPTPKEGTPPGTKVQ